MEREKNYVTRVQVVYSGHKNRKHFRGHCKRC